MAVLSIKTPKVSRVGELRQGYHPPRPTKGSGEHRKLPERGLRWSPGHKRVSVHSGREKRIILVRSNLIFFDVLNFANAHDHMNAVVTTRTVGAAYRLQNSLSWLATCRGRSSESQTWSHAISWLWTGQTNGNWPLIPLHAFKQKQQRSDSELK